MTQETTYLWIAIPAALGSAFCFGLTGALQHSANRRVAARPALRPSLLVDLARQPIWLISLLSSICGSALQLVALGTGPLVLVQPLLVSGLLFAVLIRSMMAHKSPPGSVLLGAAMCGAGLAAFLLLAQPTGGVDYLSLGQALPLAFGLAVLLTILLTMAHRFTGEGRTLALAGGAGVLYGVTAGLAKIALGLVQDHGVVALLANWPLYAILITGPAGFLLNQNAYQSDRSLAPALAVITVTDPLVGIGVGVLWLDEVLRSGPGPVIGEIIALGVLVGGVWLLAHGAPHVPRHQHPPARQTRPAAEQRPRGAGG
ncbi:MAG TPA: DMT family transporter [Pseudonocardiaceae bacterium]|nr:DMT family transporter [Pseudonocardiaceae bacterium]